MASAKFASGSDRVKGHGVSVWVEFTALARDCNAVNLGQGFPDLPPPAHATKALAEATAGENFMLNQYTRSFGHTRLVNALARLYSILLNHEIDPLNNILITVGAYHALFYSVFGLLNHGDEAIIIEPFYDCYEPQVLMAGGKPVFVPLKLPPAGQQSNSREMTLDFDELERAFSPKTKLLFLNNPNNPAGKVYTRAELEKIAKLAKKYDVVVIADEVYEWLVYEGSEMIRFASLPDMWERTITVGSAGKAFSVTGWKTGWAIGPHHLIKHASTVHQNCVFTCPTPVQEAVAVGLEHELKRLNSSECYFKEMPRMLEPNRQRMAKFLASVGMMPIVPEGGYFMLADYSLIKGPFETANNKDPKDYNFVRWLCKEKKLAAIPPSAFYSAPHKHLAENYVRFCFFKKKETLDAAEKIIQEWRKS